MMRKIDNELQQEPCALDRKDTVSVHIFEIFICTKFCIRVLAISCLSYVVMPKREKIKSVYTVQYLRFSDD